MCNTCAMCASDHRHVCVIRVLCVLQIIDMYAYFRFTNISNNISNAAISVSDGEHRLRLIWITNNDCPL